MANKRIEMTVTADGEVQIKPIGYKGPACKKVTEDLEKALGSVKADTPTAEMRETEARANLGQGGK